MEYEKSRLQMVCVQCTCTVYMCRSVSTCSVQNVKIELCWGARTFKPKQKKIFGEKYKKYEGYY